jgi:ribonuclease I
MLWLAVHLDSYGSSLPRSHAWRDAASCFLLSVRALLKAAQQLMQQLNESDMVI